jgi:protein MPE1
MSVVFYKFSAQKEFSTISFDGTGISVFDLKRQIIENAKLGKGSDFDFAIYNAESQEGK